MTAAPKMAKTGRKKVDAAKKKPVESSVLKNAGTKEVNEKSLSSSQMRKIRKAKQKLRHLDTMKLKLNDLKLFKQRYGELNEKRIIVKDKLSDLKNKEDLFADAVSVEKRPLCWIVEYSSKAVAKQKVSELKSKVKSVMYMGELKRGCIVYSCKLVVHNIQKTITTEDLMKTFPLASKIEFVEGHSQANLLFKRKEDAAKLFRKETVSINRYPCIILFALKETFKNAPWSQKGKGQITKNAEPEEKMDSDSD